MSYPFPTTPILADFLIPDEDPLSFGGKFSGPEELGQLQCQLLSHQAAAESGGTVSSSYWNVGQFSATPGLEAYFDIPVISGTDRVIVTLINNPNTGVENGYESQVNFGGTSWRLRRLDAGVATTLGANVTQATANGDGTGVRILPDGTIEVWYRNGSVWGASPLYTRSDSTYTSLYIGIIIIGTVNRIANFGGGTFAPYIASISQQQAGAPFSAKQYV
jgi:hypothetical protein